MATPRSGENRICPNCGTGFYVKPFIAKNPNKGKYCSNKCQQGYRIKLRLPNPGGFKSKPKHCATCNAELENKNKKYCSEKCKPSVASKFTQHRLKLIEQGVKQFKWHGLCNVCKKENQIYYVCNTSKTCKSCLNKRSYKNKRKNPELIIKEREYQKIWKKNNKNKVLKCIKKWKLKNKNKVRTYEKNPKNRVIRNVRKRLRAYVKNLQINKNYVSTTVGCSKKHFVEHIESKFTSKMSWDNYGTYWHIDHIIPISSFDLSDPAHCKAANHWTNLQPLEASKNIAKSNKIINAQPQLMLHC